MNNRYAPIAAFFGAMICVFPAAAQEASPRDYNPLIVETITRGMPSGGAYAKGLKPLQQTVADLDKAVGTGLGGKLKVDPAKAAQYSFCSSATYLLFAEVLDELQKNGGLKIEPPVAKEISHVGDKEEVIKGRMDGVGIFGHWNADGPGVAVLFAKLNLGVNFSDFAQARPGDFLKIFWNENIGKGERGHLVVYLGTSADGKQIQVWSSNMKNTDGGDGYGSMWVEKTRIKRAIFSRLEHPENLNLWLGLPESEKSDAYLIRIRKTGSTGEEMKRVTKAVN